MLIETNVLRAFCHATQAFANLPTIETAEQVGAIFNAALKTIGREVKLPDGRKYAPRLQSVADIPVEAFRRDQQNVRGFLKRLADDAPVGEELQATRNELAGLLQRLPIRATFGFSEKHGAARMYAHEFGVEAACYLAIFAMLEPDTTAYVRRCGLKDCENFVLHAGGRSRPSEFCCRLHAQRSQRHPKKRRKLK